MGFIRQQEEKLAIQLLIWRYRNQGLPLPSRADLKRQAAYIVKNAHDIAKKRGQNVISIIKDLANELKDKKDK